LKLHHVLHNIFIFPTALEQLSQKYNNMLEICYLVYSMAEVAAAVVVVAVVAVVVVVVVVVDIAVAVVAAAAADGSDAVEWSVAGHVMDVWPAISFRVAYGPTVMHSMPLWRRASLVLTLPTLLLLFYYYIIFIYYF
jgi:hypothetical protein